MNAALIIAIAALIIALAAGLLALGNLLALGHLARLHEAFKQNVRGIAGAADHAFKNDRDRIGAVERFLFHVFKLGQFVQEHTESGIDAALSDTKKDGGFKN